MMKKYISIILTSAMTLSLFTACAKENGTPTETQAVAAETEQTEQTIATEPPLENKGEMHGYTASELIGQMKTGWNLGNTLDATGGGDETIWGNPRTTQEMIDAVHEQGFDILRVPVTWYEHVGPAPDYKIDDDFMQRVCEVVNYGIRDDMFVILDTHHEETGWLNVSTNRMSTVEPKFEAIWKQIAEYFKDYGDKLIFEGLNEARVVGAPDEWSGGNEETRANVNKLNRIFVDTVRATGGNNAERLLLVSPYGTSSAKIAMAEMDIDYDKFTGAAVHAYCPYGFTYHPKQSWETFEWDGHENAGVDSVFKDIYDCTIDRGIPVIITEYGAVRKSLSDGSTNTAEVCKWTEYYLGKAKEYGIPCVWWDNNYYYTGNELFGLFNRKDCKWYRQEVADTIIGVYKD